MEAGVDVVLGGTSKAGRADGDDYLFGGTEGDVVIGDNAQSDVLAEAPYPTDLTSGDPAIGGTDRVVGGDGEDTLYGGLEDDSSGAARATTALKATPAATPCGARAATTTSSVGPRSCAAPTRRPVSRTSTTACPVARVRT